MAKAARITLDTATLERLLGLGPLYDVFISSAQVNNSYWKRPALEIVVYGDGLAETFTVQEGEPIQKAVITVHTKETTFEVTPL